MYLLRGFLGYLLLVVGLAMAAHGVAAITSRLLGVPAFHWFDARAANAALWRRLSVRVTSSLAPLVVAIAALFCGYLLQGSQVATTRVEVIDGPARAAGIETGDRILSVDSKPIESFEALRSEIRAGSGKRTVSLARGSRKLEISVEPRGGLIGVRPLFETRSVGASEALSSALAAPIAALGALTHDIFAEHQQRATLMSPVAIVRQSSETAASGSFILFLALLATYWWPLAAGVHLFDALTLKLFQVTHPWVRSASAAPDTARLARVHQTLGIALLATIVLGVFQALQETSFGDPALLAIILLSPAFVACVVLASIGTYLRWGSRAAAVTTLAGLFIPCAAFGISLWLLPWLRAQLGKHGYRVRGLVALPAE